MRNVVRRIDDPSGIHRIEIFENPDGTFSFDEFVFDNVAKAFCFVRDKNRSVSRTASLQESLKEARGRLPWLAEMLIDSYE